MVEMVEEFGLYLGAVGEVGCLGWCSAGYFGDGKTIRVISSPPR